MKHLILIPVLALTTVPTLAQEVQLAPCRDFGELAEIVMQGRQKNAAPSSLIDASNGDEAVKALVTLAYLEPVYVTEESQQNAVAEFRAQVELMCYKNRDGD